MYSLQQTSEGGYILGGDSQSDISGETIGGSSQDNLRSIKEISRNNYVLGGSSISRISGDKTEASRGDFDYWIVWLQYQKTAAIAASSSADLQSSLLKDNKNFSAYPNPVND